MALVLSLAAVVGGARADEEQGWSKLNEDAGLLVEARPVPGTALREIRVRVASPLSPAAIFAVLWDVAAQHDFVPNLRTVRVLRSSDDEIVVYERTKIPVVLDRDYVLRLTRHVDPATRVHEVFAEGLTEGPPPPRGVVRMTRLSSHFVIEPGASGGSMITYTSFGDPVGKLPAWIIRAADVRGPRDFVRAILKRAAQAH